MILKDAKCANLNCTNRVGEGTMNLVTIGPNTKKPVILLMCSPCAGLMPDDNGP